MTDVKDGSLEARKVALATTHGTVPAVLMDDLKAKADYVVAAGIMPQGMTAKQLVVLMLTGVEKGLSPMDAMQSLFVINNRAAEFTQLMARQLRAAGWDFYIPETTKEYCKVVLVQPNGREHTFDMAFKDAFEAGWTTKPTWKGEGQRTMLRYRTLSTAIRALAPEVLSINVRDSRDNAPREAAEAAMLERSYEQDASEAPETVLRALAVSLGVPAFLRLAMGAANAVGDAEKAAVIDGDARELPDDDGPKGGGPGPSDSEQAHDDTLPWLPLDGGEKPRAARPAGRSQETLL